MQQLFLQFPVKSEYLSEDFVVSAANENAFAYINQWPHWDDGIYSKIILIYGEVGCGKTHLAHIWQRLSNAKFIHKLEYDEFKDKALILEDIEQFEQEELLHLINIAQENQLYLLLTSKFSPGRLHFTLADLKSRILAIPSIAIDSPSQDLLKAVLFKALSDRQLKIHPAVMDYIAARIDRSFGQLFQLIEKIADLSRISKRPITIPLIKQLMDNNI